MEIINTIQKRNKLNTVYRTGDVGPGGAYHDYIIVSDGFDYEELAICNVNFQKGPRMEPNSRHGVLDTDLLEIVRDRLTFFQAGPYSCQENEMALRHVEEALLWMNKRVEDRADRNVLGTYEK